MSRELTSHRIEGMNSSIRVAVLDEPGPANACHHYEIQERVSATELQEGFVEVRLAEIRFQYGPVKDNGVNGITNEALLAIVEDRLLGFQSGEFACRENALALGKIQEAMMWLQKRTRDRIARGVEGTNQK